MNDPWGIWDGQNCSYESFEGNNHPKSSLFDMKRAKDICDWHLKRGEGGGIQIYMYV